MGSWYVSAGEMAVGDLVANSQYISMILAAIMMLALVIMLFPVSYACAKRIAEVLNTESSIKDGRYSAALRKGRACVAFDHVTFTYPGADEPVLKDVSFECRAGEVTAIIGRTGCGKSSILKLIPRLYDATVGHVYVDDMNAVSYTHLNDTPKTSLKHFMRKVFFMFDSISPSKSFFPELLILSAKLTYL